MAVLLETERAQFTAFHAEMAQDLEHLLREMLSEQRCPKRLSDALIYSVLAPGKRFRPLLLLCLYHDLGGRDYRSCLPLAASIELLHAASLIHDDLPALDNDDIRRGQASCHKAFDEATAILAGDFLVPLAIKIISDSQFSPPVLISMVRAITDSFIKLCSGQQYDILVDRGQTDVDSGSVARLKTGGLFSGTLRIAALAVGRGDLESLCGEFGSLLGVAFQIADDLDDQTSSDRTEPDFAASRWRFAHSECFKVLEELEAATENGQGRGVFSYTREIIDAAMPKSRF